MVGMKNLLLLRMSFLVIQPRPQLIVKPLSKCGPLHWSWQQVDNSANSVEHSRFCKNQKKKRNL